VDFNEARDDGLAVTSAGPYVNHLHLAAVQMTTPAISSLKFSQARCSSSSPTIGVKALELMAEKNSGVFR